LTRSRSLPFLRGAARALLLGAVLLGAGCASGEEVDADAAYKEGIKLAEDGNVAAAIASLQKGVDANPGHTRMRFELARLQYESGEGHHQRERQYMRRAAQFMDKGRRQEALGAKREAGSARSKALPYYNAARENLKIVVDEELDERRAAWGYYLLMRTDVFFEDYEAAYTHIEQAIVLGRPTGPLLAQWREYQAGLKRKIFPIGDHE
jgi:tetratricopeptide (TPR) repeat protein